MEPKKSLDRRTFLGALTAGAAAAALSAQSGHALEAESESARKRPNVVFVFADQLRAQATGYGGDPNVHTPNLDQLAGESLNFVNAVSGCPVCSPYRASLMTGQYWLTHGVFLNDVCLGNKAVSVAQAFNGAGYDTAYIGKWHIDGHGRTGYIPPERRQGFGFWRTLECTHDYNHSPYYGEDDTKRYWEGYDAEAQTGAAVEYLRDRSQERPVALFLSWGPPHNPYETAPERYKALYDPEKIVLRDNVPEEQAGTARKELAGYYSHISALDGCMQQLLSAVTELGMNNDTIVIFTSDHGDMLHSQGQIRKQRPYDESIRVPLLIRYPAGLGKEGRKLDTLVNAPDLMPTLLGLCGVPVPDTAEGHDLSGALLKGETPQVDGALLMCAAPFGEWTRTHGGREYRGLRTRRYTYVRSLDGPWLLFDNEKDPYQKENLCGRDAYAGEQEELEALLTAMLKERGDAFLPAEAYVKRWGYTVDATGTVPVRE